jgi:hypothetical protein
MGLGTEAVFRRGKEQSMANRDLKPMAIIVVAVWLSYCLGCSRSAQEQDRSPGVEASGSTPSSTATNTAAPSQKAQGQNPEPKSPEAKSVEPQVQSEVGRMEAEKRASLLKDAQAALEETQNALTALGKGDKNAALGALERATGKLDLIVSRDPKMALAPVDVTVSLLDLYATPDTVKAVVKEGKDDLSNNRVQEARHLVSNLASEADIHVVEIPLATYPAAIKAVSPLIDAGKTQEAKGALEAALNTLVIDTYVVPLPSVRAQAMLRQAEQLASKNNRRPEDNQKVHSLVEATRTEIQLAETLGYGTKDNYKPLYAQLDDIQKKTRNGESGKGLFARMEQSLKKFKFST